MAYRDHFLFRWEDIHGQEWRIIIAEDGYSGAVVQRALGAPPVLRRDHAGHIYGTSLEMTVQCDTDGEFLVLYTSDPRKFKVRLMRGMAQMWTGYISTELYSEPDIAPPYDVHIIATDGIGELKFYDWEGMGAATLHDTITHVVTKIDGIGNFWICLSMRPEGVEDYRVFHETQTNLDSFIGETYYDVLENILSMFNLSMTQSEVGWVLVNQSDLKDSYTNGYVVVGQDYGELTALTNIVALEYGDMSECDMWPVGFMSSEIIPAKKSIVIEAKAEYHDRMVNGDMTEERGWEENGSVYFDSDTQAYRIVSGDDSSISQTVSLSNVGTPLKLVVKARQKYNGTSIQNSGFLVLVRVRMRTSGGVVDRWIDKDANGQFSYSASSRAVSFQLPAPSQYDTADSANEFEIPIVLSPFLRAAGMEGIQLEVEIMPGLYYDVLVHECHLEVADQVKGYRMKFFMDNGARGEADDVELTAALGVFGNFRREPVGFCYGHILNELGIEPEAWVDARHQAVVSGTTFLDLAASDYARECALPRTLKTGVFNMPHGAFPLVLRPQGTTDLFFVDTFSWDLVNAELSVEMTSISTATVTASAVDVTVL